MKAEVSNQGFVIENLELESFMRYLNPQRINFKEKYTVITGRTGSGKTSILDAITYALYNQTSRTDIQTIKVSDICRRGGHIKLSFFQRGDRYEVERGLNLKGASYLALKKNGANIRGGISELNSAIEEVIGLDYTGFRTSTFVRQEEMKELGAETPAKRLDIFRKLFRLDIFQKAQETVKEKMGEINGEIRSNEGKAEVYTENLNEMTTLIEEQNSLKEDMSEHEELRERCADEIKDHKGKLNELEIKHEEFLKIQDRKQKLETELETLDKKIEANREEIVGSKEHAAELEELEKGAENYEELKNEGEILREKKNEHSKLLLDRKHLEDKRSELEEQHEKKLEELNRRLKKQEDRLERLSTAIDAEEAFGLLRTEGALAERLERIEKELKWIEKAEILKEIKDERKESSKLLHEVKDRTAEINKDSFVRSEIGESIERIKKDLKKEDEGYAGRNQELEEKLADSLVKIQALAFDDDAAERLDALKKDVQRIEKERKKIDELRKKLEDPKALSKLIDELDKQKKDRNEELEKSLIKIGELESFENDYVNSKKKLEELGEDSKRLEKIVGEKGGELKRVVKRLENLKAQKEELKKIEAKLKELREVNEAYTVLKDDIFHNRGIVLYAINQILPQLSTEASNNLNDLSAGRFNKVSLEAKGEGARYGIGIMVEGLDGTQHDVFEFSGGEKTQINAALRFAIAKELACLPQVGRTYGRMRTLFIDEGDLGSLDTEVSRGLFVKKLLDMGEFFDKIILITHLSDVAETFPGKIQIEMSSENESRIYTENGGDQF